MSQQNLVAVNIPAAELQNISKLITDLQTALAPYVITLSADDRKSLLKMSDKSVAFVNKIVDYSTTNPEFIPPYLSVADMKIDVDAVTQLQPLFISPLQMCIMEGKNKSYRKEHSLNNSP